MLTPCKQRIQVDDITVGTRMTVFKNLFNASCTKGSPESDYLKGTVLQVQAISLPYLLVHATDPLKGRCKLSVDVRDHLFMPISDSYAEAVLEGSTDNPDDSHGN